MAVNKGMGWYYYMGAIAFLALCALLSTCHDMQAHGTITVEIALPAREKVAAVVWPPKQASSPDVWRKWKPCNDECID